LIAFISFKNVSTSLLGFCGLKSFICYHLTHSRAHAHCQKGNCIFKKFGEISILLLGDSSLHRSETCAYGESRQRKAKAASQTGQHSRKRFSLADIGNKNVIIVST